MIQLDGGLEDPGKKMRNSFNWIVKAIKEARGNNLLLFLSLSL
jgi:hypothetical protein